MTSSVIKYSDYNVGKLELKPLPNPKKKSLQSILLPAYDDGRTPLIQLPVIELSMYGVPSKCEFFNSLGIYKSCSNGRRKR